MRAVKGAALRKGARQRVRIHAILGLDLRGMRDSPRACSGLGVAWGSEHKGGGGSAGNSPRRGCLAVERRRVAFLSQVCTIGLDS